MLKGTFTWESEERKRMRLQRGMVHVEGYIYVGIRREKKKASSKRDGPCRRVHLRGILKSEERRRRRPKRGMVHVEGYIYAGIGREKKKGS